MQPSSAVPFSSAVVRLPMPMLIAILVSFAATANAQTASFSRDILPILSDRCFHCHGPDDSHREAELRLDQRESVIADREGHPVIVPGRPDQSELISRITTDDPDLLMPPPDSHRKPLTQREIDALKTWVAAGAQWGRHWSFEPPVRVDSPDESLHPIDAFVRHRLSSENLQPAPQAEKHTLLRRVSFDLTGLPPTTDEVAAFLADDSPQAVDNVVDRLLKSPHYGERMAMWWLDLARYSDTDGYQGDSTRNNWPWRDWVIEAFNRNMPFSQFTIEQFAGDLLPDATPEQQLATCFHRNHMTNGEGGRDPEESRIDYVIDRVNTMGTVWLGLTLGCSQCHNHKFDPISQQDYYSFNAFFNSIDEDGRAGGGAKPYLKYRSPFAARAVAEAQSVVDARIPIEVAARKAAEHDFEPWLDEQIRNTRNGFTSWHVLAASETVSVEGTILTQEPDGTIQTAGPILRQDDYRIVASTQLPRVTGLRLEVFPHVSHTDGKLSRGASGEFILTDVKLQLRKRGQSQLRDIDISTAVADVEKTAKGRAYGNVKDTLDDDPRNGWTTEGHAATQSHVAVFGLAEPLLLADDDELIFVMLHRSTVGDANIGRFRVSVTDQPGDAVRSLTPMPLSQLAEANIDGASKIDSRLRGQLLNQFLEDHPAWQQAKSELDDAQSQLAEVKRASGDLNVMVLSDRKEPRSTHVLVRGVWDKKGPTVSTAFPPALFAGARREDLTRLDLAKWLVSPENPLTARVVVNHLWQLCFGAGLVRTPDDFGLQGELPTHPDLLDWLAVELIEHDWDLQHILRLIVTSHTYQQRSTTTAELQELDPDNRLLARGARYRLPSWMIRDAALQSSGLLNPAIGGPSTRPYQPAGVWAEMFMGRFRYEPSQGAVQFRRTLYAFWRRSAAPTFLFDSAQRRVCEVQPRRTNTPLHALTLLNDLSVLESARAVARQSLAASDSSDPLPSMFERILSRRPTAKELAVLQRELDQILAHYKATPGDATAFLKFGQPEHRAAADPDRLASHTIIASMLFNLDEAMTHE